MSRLKDRTALLIIPPSYKRSKYFFDVHLGIAYLAAALVKAGKSVQILDLNLHKQPWAILLKRIKEVSPIFLALSVTTSNYHKGLRIIRIAHRFNDDIPCIIGGPHITSVDLNSTRRCPADVIVRGEGEIVIVDLFDRIQRDGGEKFCRKYSGSPIIINTERYNFNLIKSIPWHLFPIHTYLRKNEGYISLICSRGCAKSCIFCVSKKIWGNRIIYRNTELIVSDIKQLQNINDKIQINFRDDDIAYDGNYLRNLLLALQPLNIKWKAEVSVESINIDILKQMCQSGLNEIRIGLESTFNKGRNILGKQSIEMDNFKSIINALHNFNTKIKINVLIGIPGLSYEETMQDICNLEKMKHNGLTFNINIITPLPGSKIHYHPDHYGIEILDTTYKHYIPGKATYMTTQLSINQIEELYFFAKGKLSV